MNAPEKFLGKTRRNAGRRHAAFPRKRPRASGRLGNLCRRHPRGQGHALRSADPLHRRPRQAQGRRYERGDGDARRARRDPAARHPRRSETRDVHARRAHLRDGHGRAHRPGGRHRGGRHGDGCAACGPQGQARHRAAAGRAHREGGARRPRASCCRRCSCAAATPMRAWRAPRIASPASSKWAGRSISTSKARWPTRCRWSRTSSGSTPAPSIPAKCSTGWRTRSDWRTTPSPSNAAAWAALSAARRRRPATWPCGRRSRPTSCAAR